MRHHVTSEEEWHDYLMGTHPSIAWGRRLFGHIPWSPRCRVCLTPFGGPGGWVLRLAGVTQWEKNPTVCNWCIRMLDNRDVSGAEAEISFLFADVRRSSALAREMDTMAFTRLMQRFYTTASAVFLERGAILDKFVGDAVVGFFLPFITGPDHAGSAIRAAQDLLLAVGHGGDGDPWLPLGAGVNTGTTFVGLVSSGTTSEFTAFGDAINVAAHLAAQAGPGEILTTDATMNAARFTDDGLERRHLSLKGHQVDALVLPLAPVASA